MSLGVFATLGASSAAMSAAPQRNNLSLIILLICGEGGRIFRLGERPPSFASSLFTAASSSLRARTCLFSSAT